MGAPIGFGTAVNVVTVAIGGMVGLSMRGRLPDGLRQTVLTALGMFTVVMGIRESLSGNLIVIGAALLVGAVAGELIGIEASIERLGGWLERRFGGAEGSPGLARGFVVASILYCVGPLTVLGCLQDGLGEPPRQLLVKALLDGFAAIPLAAAFGVGVLFSIGTIIVIQGGLTLFAGQLDGLLTEVMRQDAFATGGIMVMAIGLNLMDLKKIRTANLLPALVAAPLFAHFGPSVIELAGL